MTAISRTTLPNGVRFVCERMADCASASVSLTLANGARWEDDATAGSTHFVEHLLFKGTPSRDVDAIAREINLQGGTMNAYTSHDCLRVYSHVVVEDLEPALDLIHDMVTRSTMPEGEIERERGVILEEIAEAHDAPEDVCFEQFLSSLWAPHPMGRPVIGSEETVGAMSRGALVDRWQAMIDPRHMVVSVAGGIDIAEAESIVARMFTAPAGADALPAAHGPRASRSGTFVQTRRDLEQVHFTMGVPGLKVGHEDRYALVFFDLILGGSMGSRLFREVRERRGLAYTIGSNSSSFFTEGYLSIYGATTPDKLAEMLTVCEGEARRLAADGPTDEEMMVATRQAVRGLVLARESSSYRASRNADRELYDEPHLTLDEVLARIKAVTTDDVRALGAGLLEGKTFTTSLVGPPGIKG